MKTFATIFSPFDDVEPTLSAANDIHQPPSVPTTVDPSAPLQSLEPRYAVRDVLGRGGMGEVRLCRDGRIGRDVAVKVALKGAASSRFLREARVQGQLEHPSIVPVYDLEILDDGSAYFVMKRVRGKTLAQLLKDDSFPLRKLLSAFSSVCLAVDLAHNKGVVHRDIKPGNVMLGDFGEVYLLDWGLAKIRGTVDEPSLDVELPPAGATAAGSLLGTPGYMAPEQIDTELAPITAATDVYALGAVLFEIAARDPYIRAADSLEATVLTLRGVEPRPSLRAPSRAVPPALDAICAKALAKAPKDRFASARELHDAVDAWLAGEQQLTQRKEMSAMHLASADRALAETDEGARKRALAELGSAIAVDPSNEKARAALLTLLTSPPTTEPPEVTARILADKQEQMRIISRFTTLTSLPYFAFAPFAMWVGVKDYRLFVMALVAIGIGAGINYRLSKNARPPMSLQYLSTLSILCGHIAFTRFAGPIAILPAMLVAFATARQVHPDPWHRRIITAAACAVIGVGLVLELLDPQYFLVDGGVLVRENVLRLDGHALIFFVAASVVTIITPSFYLARTRAALAEAERSMHLQRWQLEQLVRP